MYTVSFDDEDMKKCLDFAERIYWKHPHFRDRRNTATRSKEQLIEDIVRGRLAEIAIHRHFKQVYGYLVSDLDFEIYPSGITDDIDIKVGDIRISIKSSKPNSSCLMIETAKFVIEKGKLVGIDKKKCPDILVFVQVDVSNKSAIICGAITMDSFWTIKKFMPRGMWMNRENAKRFFLQNRPLDKNNRKGGRLLADNYGVHIAQLSDPIQLINSIFRCSA